MWAVDDASDHPAVAVDPDEAHHTGGDADHFATPRAILDRNFGRVLAQRVGEFAGHLTPEPAGLRCRVGRNAVATVGCDDPHRAGNTALGQLDLYLTRGRHRNQHRAQVQPGQHRHRRVIEVVDVEWALKLLLVFDA
ncbi:Uncharacterised protein [Mycobacterium tuberculosis]|nr:Uncharacterised protein [Mycobacterium tuberculosis]